MNVENGFYSPFGVWAPDHRMMKHESGRVRWGSYINTYHPLQINKIDRSVGHFHYIVKINWIRYENSQRGGALPGLLQSGYCVGGVLIGGALALSVHEKWHFSISLRMIVTSPFYLFCLLLYVWVKRKRGNTGCCNRFRSSVRMEGGAGGITSSLLQVMPTKWSIRI